VLVQVAFQGEGFVASLARVVLGRRVRLHVGSEVGPIRKGLPAMGTPVRLLPGMTPHVTLEEPGPGEGLPTDVTLVMEVVREDVHGEGRHAHVRLPTGRTPLGRLGVEAPMRLLMAGQIRTRRVVFPALGTRVAGLGPAADRGATLRVRLGILVVRERVLGELGREGAGKGLLLGAAVRDKECFIGVGDGARGPRRVGRRGGG